MLPVTWEGNQGRSPDRALLLLITGEEVRGYGTQLPPW